MKAPLLCLALLLTACQATPSLAPTLTPTRLQSQRSAISPYYPIENGRSWTYSLEQSQNGEDNTKFKTMTMTAESLPADGAVEQAVLRRSYPDSGVVPNATLVRRFGDRVELSRYQPTPPTNGDSGLLSVLTPNGANLAAGLATSRGINFITVLQLPFAPGTSWEGRIFNGGTETVSVVGEETLDLPAGRFKTLKIEHHKRYANGKEDFLYYWYAPGVGMVKLYEELTFYYGQWLKFRSTGVLTGYTAGQQRP